MLRKAVNQVGQADLQGLVLNKTAESRIRPFLPSGIGRYTHMRHVNAAFRYAFADRLSSAELGERRSMSERIGQMIADAPGRVGGRQKSPARHPFILSLNQATFPWACLHVCSGLTM